MEDFICEGEVERSFNLFEFQVCVYVLVFEVQEQLLLIVVLEERKQDSIWCF